MIRHERACDNCGEYPRQLYFNIYPAQIMKVNKDELVPVFCNMSCMLEWVSRKTKRSLPPVQLDFYEAR